MENHHRICIGVKTEEDVALTAGSLKVVRSRRSAIYFCWDKR